MDQDQDSASDSSSRSTAVVSWEIRTATHYTYCLHDKSYGYYDNQLVFWGYPKPPISPLPLVIHRNLPKYVSVKEKIDLDDRFLMSQFFAAQRSRLTTPAAPAIVIDDSPMQVSDDSSIPPTEIDSDSDTCAGADDITCDGADDDTCIG